MSILSFLVIENDQFPLYGVRCTLLGVECTLHTIYGTLCTDQYSLYTVKDTAYRVCKIKCILCTSNYSITLYSVYCIVHNGYWALGIGPFSEVLRREEGISDMEREEKIMGRGNNTITA